MALNSWGGRLALVLALRFVVFDLASCNAVEPPTVAELRRAHLELRAASSNVQGEIRVYRSETVIPRAFEKLPSDIGIPLRHSGNVWRSKQRFRADFKSYDLRSDVAKESQHSVVFDGRIAYEFNSGLDPDSGVLRVCDVDTPEAAVVLKLIEGTFYQPLDALWSTNGIAFVDLLQSPSTRIVPNDPQRLPGGYSLLASEGGNATQFQLEPTHNYPFGYVLASDGEGGSAIRAERRAFSVEKEGVMFPTRVVDVVSFGSGTGYTEVVTLDLRPLEDNSPIASEITAASFQNLGIGYQVYNFRKSEKEEVAERYERQVALSPRPGGNFRFYFLWLNGFVILAILAYVTYRYVTRRRSG